jgi:CheY-like chemotaxis protein
MDGHLEAALKLQPDIIVLDIAMPRLNGFDAARELKAKMPRVKLIFMTCMKLLTLWERLFGQAARHFY